MKRFLFVLKKLLPWMSVGSVMSFVIICIIFIFADLRIIASQTASISEVTSQVFIRDKEFGFLSRLEVNAVIESKIKQGKIEDVLIHYDALTKNREVTFNMVSYCLMYEVPVNLLFALAQHESGFYATAMNSNHTSSDIGIMQLNTSSYSAYKEAQLFDIKTNIRLGASHLQGEFVKYDRWEFALLGYNCGGIREVPDSTIRYMVSILNIERSFDRQFGDWLYTK